MATDYLIQNAQDANSGAVHISGCTVSIGVELTRPADTTAYAVGDSINTSTTVPTVLTFAGAARGLANSGYITKAIIITTQVACIAQLRLWLFKTATPFLSNDNAAFLTKYVDRDNLIGFIDLPSLAAETGSDCALAIATDVRMAFMATPTTGVVYALLETKTAFTPANGQKFFVNLTAEQN